MVTRLLPEIGRWYAHRDKGEIFQVVAVDDHARVVEIQDVDGDVDEIELDAAFVDKLQVQPGMNHHKALVQYCLLLLNANEFLYLD